MKSVSKSAFSPDLDEVQAEVYKHSWIRDDPFFSMNAFVGELGELSNVLKKEVYAEMMPNYSARVAAEVLTGKRTSFQEQKIDEAGDALFFFVQTLNACKLNLNEVWNNQMDKLRKQGASLGSEGKIFRK